MKRAPSAILDSSSHILTIVSLTSISVEKMEQKKNVRNKNFSCGKTKFKMYESVCFFLINKIDDSWHHEKFFFAFATDPNVINRQTDVGIRLKISI